MAKKRHAAGSHVVGRRLALCHGRRLLRAARSHAVGSHAGGPRARTPPLWG
jgi:hypothetical protein